MKARPPDLESLLDAERHPPAPPAEARERVLRRVETTLGLATVAAVAAATTTANAGTTAVTTTGTTAATTTGAAAAATGAHAALVGKAIVLKVLAAAVGATLVGGGAYVAVQQKPVPVLSRAPDENHPPERRLPLARTSHVVVPPMAKAAPPPKPPRPYKPGIADEQAFLEEARAALRNGSPERALKLLAQHERAFANAQLGDARESLAIQALVAEGRVDAARARATEFRRRYPRSLFQPAVDASLPR